MPFTFSCLQFSQAFIYTLICIRFRYNISMSSTTASASSDVAEDYDIPHLSAETFSALQEFYKEQEHKEDILTELQNSENSSQTIENISEDWQLSQFWYDEVTSYDLAKEVLRLATESADNSNVGSIACVSCPTLYIALKKHFPSAKCKGNLAYV